MTPVLKEKKLRHQVYDLIKIHNYRILPHYVIMVGFFYSLIYVYFPKIPSLLRHICPTPPHTHAHAHLSPPHTCTYSNPPTCLCSPLLSTQVNIFTSPPHAHVHLSPPHTCPYSHPPTCLCSPLPSTHVYVFTPPHTCICSHFTYTIPAGYLSFLLDSQHS